MTHLWLVVVIAGHGNRGGRHEDNEYPDLLQMCSKVWPQVHQNSTCKLRLQEASTWVVFVFVFPIYCRRKTQSTLYHPSYRMHDKYDKYIWVFCSCFPITNTSQFSAYIDKTFQSAVLYVYKPLE